MRLKNYLSEDITIPINVGDIVLGGKFKNKRVTVKKIGKNEKGDVTINGKALMRFRVIPQIDESLLLEKRMPMFHGTRSRNLSGIKSGGLRIGSPSNKGAHGYTDTDDKIFMSDNYNDAFQQITQFVTNGEPVAILQINPVFDYETLNRKGEWISYEDIPASLISVWMPKVKQRSYKKQKFQLISIKKIKPENINYINFDLLHGADLSSAQKYWSN